MSTPTNESNESNESPEEIRRAMKIRFDEVNKAAEERHRLRRDAGNLEAAEENRRWVRREPDIDGVDEK